MIHCLIQVLSYFSVSDKKIDILITISLFIMLSLFLKTFTSLFHCNVSHLPLLQPSYVVRQTEGSQASLLVVVNHIGRLQPWLVSNVIALQCLTKVFHMQYGAIHQWSIDYLQCIDSTCTKLESCSALMFRMFQYPSSCFDISYHPV